MLLRQMQGERQKSGYLHIGLEPVKPHSVTIGMPTAVRVGMPNVEGRAAPRSPFRTRGIVSYRDCVRARGPEMNTA